MKKFFSKIWKSIFADPGFIGRILLILLVIAILVGAMILSGPKPENHMILNPTKTATPQENPETQIPVVPAISPEYVQTTGVIVAVCTVVVVILTGTLLEYLRDRKKNKR